MLRSTTSRYGAIPVTIHRLVAILAILALGSRFQAGSALAPDTKACACTSPQRS
ncbi:hypothetical protein FHX09_005313 [Rhizobium sp. BK538]|nr:hypothetical protein [Rhizobium sp. BK060]MBB4171421.1 hypothetical protein [Rhizobium sp. BK538]TCM68924.1 hypothetical protein EV291_12846 [Rhizobium sp. BK068]